MNLLLIHTGGTIGMVPGPNGLMPQDGLVEAAVAARLPDHVTLHQHLFTPLIDSASVGPDHWNEILDVIDAHPNCPVLLIHGTDTLSFSGAALSQAREGLGRRVVLCASMMPLGAGGDAEGNLEFALKALIDGTQKGVFLSFAGKLLPASGLVKHHCSDPDAFRAIPQDVLLPPKCRRFSPKKLAIVTLAAGLPAAALRALLAELDGAVLRVFGAGTIMSDVGIIAALSDAIQRGVAIRAVSQCEVGHVAPGAYAAGAPLWDCGVQSGGRETPEAALIHLWLNG
jgi:L-asparaginase